MWLSPNICGLAKEENNKGKDTSLWTIHSGKWPLQKTLLCLTIEYYQSLILVIIVEASIFISVQKNSLSFSFFFLKKKNVFNFFKIMHGHNLKWQRFYKSSYEKQLSFSPLSSILLLGRKENIFILLTSDSFCLLTSK